MTSGPVLNGVDIHTTSKLLGHTGLSHTIRYLRASKELNKKAVERFAGD
jgi:hypothetical protein